MEYASINNLGLSREEISKEFDKLVVLEPKLNDLLLYCINYDTSSMDRWCVNKAWYGRNGMKQRMNILVGWTREEDGDSFLASHEAYDIAYETLYNALPDCGGCWCNG